MLNKLYIVWDKIIPIQFKWTPLEPNFVVRALPVYTDAQDMKLAVKRCLIHLNPSDTSNDGSLKKFFYKFLKCKCCNCAN